MDVEVHVHDDEDAVWAARRQGPFQFLGPWPHPKAVSEGGQGEHPCLGGLRAEATAQPRDEATQTPVRALGHMKALFLLFLISQSWGTAGVSTVGQDCGRKPLSEVLLQTPGRWSCPGDPLARVQLGPEQVANGWEQRCILCCSLASTSRPRSKVCSPRVPATF